MSEESEAHPLAETALGMAETHTSGEAVRPATPPPAAVAAAQDATSSADATADATINGDGPVEEIVARSAERSEPRDWQGDRPEPRILPYAGDASEPEDALIGQTLSGLYRVEAQIGQGGMDTVYLAVHIHLERPFAVKVLAETVASNQEAVKRLLQEARTASSIDHENIVDVVSFDTTADGRVFIVMEFLEGTSLGDLIEDEGAMALERMLPVAIQVCRALDAAHERGIVHRDLKPDNVFLVRHRAGHDFVKVLDFGISKVQTAEAEQVRMTKTGQLVGTPLYMSPEQARGDTNIDLRADIYALGVMLFEMITGRPPFDGSNYFQLLWKHGNEPPPLMRERMPSVPAALDDVVQRALAKKREERFQSMAELEEALLAALPEVMPPHLASLPPRSSDPRPSDPRSSGSNPALARATPAESFGDDTSAEPDAREALRDEALRDEALRNEARAGGTEVTEVVPVATPLLPARAPRGLIAAALVVLALVVGGALAVGRGSSSTESTNVPTTAQPPAETADPSTAESSTAQPTTAASANAASATTPAHAATSRSSAGADLPEAPAPRERTVSSARPRPARPSTRGAPCWVTRPRRCTSSPAKSTSSGSSSPATRASPSPSRPIRPTRSRSRSARDARRCRARRGPAGARG